MSFEKYYDQCRQNINKAVEIECQGGIMHHGVIESVDQEKVYLRTFEQWDRPADPPGPGVFAYGFGPAAFPGAFFGGFTGSLLGVGLGSILAFRPYGPYGYGPYGPGGPGGPGPYGPGGFGPGPFY